MEEFDKPADFLYSLDRIGDKLELDKIRRFLRNFGEPQKDFDSILVGGTNGKGSVATMTSNILIESGYKTGLYTSPHHKHLEERIKINNQEIPREKLWKLIKKIKPTLDQIENKNPEERPSFFETITSLAYIYFSKKNIDIAVLEVGMGGRLDATNVVDNFASVVTNVGFDHSKYLGNTKKEIAKEKAGIIKENNYFVTEEKNENITNYFKKICKERNSDYNHALKREHEILKEPLRLKLTEYGEIKIPGVAEWQAENALTAITLTEKLKQKNYNITDKNIVNGIENSILQDRMETISKDPWIMIDSAHNVTGMEALFEGLDEIDYDDLLLVMGILEDKSYEEMVEIIGPICDKAFAGEPISERKLNSKTLAKELQKHCNTKIYKKGSETLNAAIKEAKENDLILITGSIYFIGDIRKQKQI